MSAAGVLVTDELGRILLVRTHHRTGLVLPGGIVEEGESPAAAAVREVAEELGVHARLTRLLVVQHAARDGHPIMHFVFAGLLGAGPFRLQAAEIADVRWLPPADAVLAHVPTGQRRLGAAIAAARTERTTYLDDDLDLS